MSDYGAAQYARRTHYSRPRESPSRKAKSQNPATEGLASEQIALIACGPLFGGCLHVEITCRRAE